MTPIESAWMVNSGNQSILVCKRNFILHSYGNRKNFIWSPPLQLKKFSSVTSWPARLENQQSWIIKIGAEFIMQVSLVLPQRTLHDGKNHLVCDVKILGLKNWFIEVWMSAETGLSWHRWTKAGITRNCNFLCGTN